MRVLVTGHKGYIGTVLTPMLESCGHDVAGLDSDIFRRCTYGNDLPSVRQESMKDIRDVEYEDVAGYDAVIHLAALSNDPLGDLDEQLTYEINWRASIRLAELCKKAKIKRFIFSSSCSNYGAGGDSLLNEDAALNPLTAYGISKVRAECDLGLLADRNFCPVYLRSATAYGVSPRLRFDLVLNNLVAWAYTAGEVHLKSDGSPWRPVVHISDIARAAIAVLDAPAESVCNRAFNVGVPGENFQVLEIAEIVCRTVPHSTLGFAAGASADKRNYRVDCRRLPEIVPAYKPAWTAARGADELYRSYRKNGVTLEEFEGSRYNRVAHVKMLIQNGKLSDQLRVTA